MKKVFVFAFFSLTMSVLGTENGFFPFLKNYFSRSIPVLGIPIKSVPKVVLDHAKKLPRTVKWPLGIFTIGFSTIKAMNASGKWTEEERILKWNELLIAYQDLPEKEKKIKLLEELERSSDWQDRYLCPWLLKRDMFPEQPDWLLSKSLSQKEALKRIEKYRRK